MATLLEGVNKVLRRTQIINSDLTSLTSSGSQPYIDTAVGIWNEIILKLYSLTDKAVPNEVARGTITLVDGDRDYSLASDLVQLRFPLHDTTNGQFIEEYPSGFLGMKSTQSYPANETGLAYLGAISPIDGLLYLDKIPTSDDDGKVYEYFYDKDITMSLATDTFPFNDSVFTALIPAVAQQWAAEIQNKFVDRIYNESFALAAQLVSQSPLRGSWTPRAYSRRISDPYAD